MKFLVRLFNLWLDAVAKAVRHIDLALYSALRWLSGTSRPPRRPDPFTVEEEMMSQLLCVYRVTYPPIPADETDVIGRRLVIRVGDEWGTAAENVDEIHSVRSETIATFEVPQNTFVMLSLFHGDAGGNESSEPRTVEFTSKDLAPNKPDDFTVDFVEMTETSDTPAEPVAEAVVAAPVVPQETPEPVDTPEAPAETPEAVPEAAPAAPEALAQDTPAEDTPEVPPVEAPDDTVPPAPQGDSQP